MPETAIDALVFDVLGTLVDEPSGLRAGILRLAPESGRTEADRLLALWTGHIEREQQRVLDGGRSYPPGGALDREAAQIVARAAGAAHPEAAELARSARRLPAWPDSASGLARLAEGFPVVGLSNAGRAALLEISAHAGLRWHQALSAEEVRSYKPDPAVYRLAAEAAGRPPERLLMVAAHAWDLRAARAAGLRTAYVRRPAGDPPSPSDRFDLHAGGLDDLAGQLAGGAAGLR